MTTTTPKKMATAQRKTKLMMMATKTTMATGDNDKGDGTTGDGMTGYDESG